MYFTTPVKLCFSSILQMIKLRFRESNEYVQHNQHSCQLSIQPKEGHRTCAQRAGPLLSWPIFPPESYTTAAFLHDSLILLCGSDAKDKKEKSLSERRV